MRANGRVRSRTVANGRERSRTVAYRSQIGRIASGDDSDRNTPLKNAGASFLGPKFIAENDALLHFGRRSVGRVDIEHVCHLTPNYGQNRPNHPRNDPPY